MGEDWKNSAKRVRKNWKNRWVVKSGRSLGTQWKDSGKTDGEGWEKNVKTGEDLENHGRSIKNSSKRVG